VLSDEHLWALFSNYEDENTGKITLASLKAAFKRLGMDKPDTEIAEIFEAHDINKDGGIDFDEFKALFEEQSV
jgi:Ca2+-binding EF-hand superfamily protein